MKLLILGGTKFVGPHLIEAAAKRGHEITIFTRGRQDPANAAGAEHIRGDRNKDLHKFVGRHWDVVIDTCGYLPRSVCASAEFFADRADRYVFISSLSVYTDFAAMGIDENAPTATLTDAQVERANEIDTSGSVSAVSFGELYGGLKALCEKAAEQAMPGRVLTLRPGLIVGPQDYTARFTYWVARVAGGGEVLAPGRPGREIQFIDVRDLAEWTVRMVEREQTGIFNVDGLPGFVTMEELLETIKSVTGSDAAFAWVPDEFLIENGVAPWSEMPLWLPEYDSADSRGFMFIDVQKAVDAGLTLRPIEDTVRETLAWYLKANDGLRAGLDREKENRLLDKWRSMAA
jgi:2'-hydroxyisoflavone reductase